MGLISTQKETHMALFNTTTNDIWRGEEINNVRYPLNIELLWTEQELENLGLVKIVPPVVDPTNSNILNAPEKGFGGPNGKELFNGNR